MMMKEGNSKMADKRTAGWTMMGDDRDWVVDFFNPDGDHVGTYHSNDFQDVLSVHAAWINNGDLPEDLEDYYPDLDRKALKMWS